MSVPLPKFAPRKLKMEIDYDVRYCNKSRIFSYSALIWGSCAWLSIPLTEEGVYLEFPSLWSYRHLFALGACYMISQSV